jgi:hypothetical protein
MKIVHEIRGKTTCSGSVDAYRDSKENGYADVLIVASSHAEGVPADAIYFEGDALSMLEAFRKAVIVLERSLEFISKNEVA